MKARISKLCFSLILLFSFVFLTGCYHAPNALEDQPIIETDSVIIDNFSYSPPRIMIEAGDTVSWVNQDSAIHTVTSENNFDSGDIEQGDRYSHTFDQPGIIEYTCTYHPSMVGQIIIE